MHVEGEMSTWAQGHTVNGSSGRIVVSFEIRCDVGGFHSILCYTRRCLGGHCLSRSLQWSRHVGARFSMDMKNTDNLKLIEVS